MLVLLILILLIVFGIFVFTQGSVDTAIAYIAEKLGLTSSAPDEGGGSSPLDDGGSSPPDGGDSFESSQGADTFESSVVQLSQGAGGGAVVDSDLRDSNGQCIERDCEIVVGTYPKSYSRKFHSRHRDSTSCLCSATCDQGWECMRPLQDGQMYAYAVRQVDFETGACLECPPICGVVDSNGNHVSEEYCMITATDGTRMRLQDANGNDVLKTYDCQCPSPCPNVSMKCPSGVDRIYQPGTKYHCKCPAEQRLEADGMTHACQTGGPEGDNFTNMDILNSGSNAANILSWTSWYNCYPEDNDFAPGRYPADSNSECQCNREDLQRAVDATVGMDPNAYYNVCQWSGIEADGCGRATVEEIQKYECTDMWGEPNCRRKKNGSTTVRLRSHVETGTGSAFTPAPTTAPPTPAPGIPATTAPPTLPPYTHPCKQVGNKSNKQLAANIWGWNSTVWSGADCRPENNDFAPGYYEQGTGSNEGYCNPYQLTQAVERAYDTNNVNEQIGVCGNENEHGLMSAGELRKYNCTGEWGSTDCQTKQVDGLGTVNMRREVYARVSGLNFATITEPEASGSNFF